MFVKDGCILVTYVDDAIIMGRDQAAIDAVLSGLKSLQLDYDHLGDLAAYLGVEISRNDDGTMELKQPHLSATAIAALGLEDSNPKSTPATQTLGKCEESTKMREDFNYRSVVGTLMYVGNHSQLDCAFSIHQCARFSADPREPHGEAIKRIGRYLQGTQNRGLILRPSRDLKLDLHVDADFAGLWGSEKPTDPASVRSRTGYILTLGGAPVLWASRLQSLICCSTMESEYVAASTGMRALVPMRRKLFEMCAHLHLAIPEASQVSTVWEDNQAALQLATTDPPRMTPRSKSLAVHYHWFRAHLIKGEIEMRAVASKNNLADILTKALSTQEFERARKSTMGW
jgi:hypothetical protein